MRDEPTGEQLLDSAERLLREQLLALLPTNQRQAGLMIAKAMGIAARQLRNGEEALRIERTALSALLGQDGPAEQAELTAQLLDGNRKLCRLIRAGDADAGERRQQVYTHLIQGTRQKLAESNPRALASQT